ncbi:septum formation inhibitor Maf [Lewinella sp. IMCC34191]|uniref:septum formation inhibitor Maf n=1 Tax=Lewinella sp. IMCC34191 TaxID=2259172 RepID=UPI000E27F7B6|nr:septum formation inhibitor Maf [Lewinella sp. IMCC34191]
MKIIQISLLGLLLQACNASVDSNIVNSDEAVQSGTAIFGGELSDYWYQGEAEISTYTLSQARYGELREGQAVLIQVSEPFLADRQVKDEGGGAESGTSAAVLKTNLIRRFVTGIYDYSLMTSVFTPTDGTTYPNTLKVTTSSQDWCGQSYTQLNYTGSDKWRMQLRSYFEREGDQDVPLAADFLEDEIFNRIRIGGKLPEGSFQVIPSTGYLLMTHQAYRAAPARASNAAVGDSLQTYSLEYTDLPRRLEITYEADPPYVIRAWTETYPSGDTTLTTTATLNQQRTEPYWSQNANANRPLRADLGLE